MSAALKTLRILHIVMLGGLGMFVFLPEWLNPHPSKAPDRTIFYVITLAAIMDVLVMMFLRRSTIGRSIPTLVQDPDNQAALGRWRAGYIVTFAFCISIGLFGMNLRFIGFTLAQVWPFYVASIGIMLYFFPRNPSQN